MKEYLQLKPNNIVKAIVKDVEGNETECEIAFDLEDIEMPLKISKCEYEHNKNEQWLRNQFIIIEKKQDKQDGYLTYRERLKLEAYKEFYEKEIKALDLILGEGKTNEILKAMKRKPYYSMFDDINEMLEPILPKLKQTTDDITNKIKAKYTQKEEDTLE